LGGEFPSLLSRIKKGRKGKGKVSTEIEEFNRTTNTTKINKNMNKDASE